MNKRTVVFGIGFWLAVIIAASAFAQEYSSSLPGDRAVLSALVSSEDEKEPDPESLSAYEKAARQERRIEQELQALREMSFAVWDIKRHASYATSWMKGAKQVWSKRDEAIASLPKMEKAALEYRNTAVAAIDAYRAAAGEALEAIVAHATADQKAAEGKARLADSAVERKLAMKRRAENAVADAVAADRDHRALVAEILRHDEEVERQLTEAQVQGAAVVNECQGLQEMAKGQGADLAAAADAFLAEVRSSVEPFVQHVADILSRDRKAYRSLVDDLVKAGGGDSAERAAAVEEYFKAAVYAVVSAESHAFLAAAQGANAAGKASAEIAEASRSVEKALAAIDASRQTIMMDIAAARTAQAALVAKIKTLPIDAKVAELLAESSTLDAGIDQVEREIELAMETKTMEYAAVRRAADEAYLLAFGRERQYESQMAEAAPAPAPLPAPRIEKAIEVAEHVFALVDALGGEPANYGAYTYVLFRQNYQEAQSHVKERYDALLEAIFRSTSAADRFMAPIPKEKLNIFCIPFRDDEYDADLARSYLATAGSGAILRKEIISKVRNSPGPFLLTTRTRLGEGGSKTQVLFVDLSMYPADAFDSILAAYKNTLVESPPAGQEAWIPPAMQRVVYAGISVAGAIPGLLENIRKLFDFFVPSDRK